MAVNESQQSPRKVIDEVVGHLNEIAANDGGSVLLRSFEPETGQLEVEFDQGTNEECETCAVDANLVHTFLQEGLRSHGVELDEVKVVAPRSEEEIE